MSYAAYLAITKDTATPALNAARNFMQPARLNPIVGGAAIEVYKTHLFGVNASRPNKLGGSRTNYFGMAAKLTNFREVEGGVLISIPQIGIRQRFYGGVIKPKTAKFLTIPVNAAAYGHRASEFDLEIVFGQGGQPIALATISTRATQITQKGQWTRTKQIGRHGVIMFRLVRSVTQKPDPTILPYDEQVLKRVDKEVGSAFKRDIARAGQGSGNGGAIS